LRRIEDILAAITAIEDYVLRAGGIEQLLQIENEFHDAVERRLSIISEAAVKLGAWAEQMEPDIPWSGIRGLGNALRHNYDAVLDDVIRAVVTIRLPALKTACLRVRQRLGKQPA
jgi:uncharacterized protein with HEPN domain